MPYSLSVRIVEPNIGRITFLLFLAKECRLLTFVSMINRWASRVDKPFPVELPECSVKTGAAMLGEEIYVGTYG